MELEYLQQIIEYTKWSPSGDNTQPFHYFWDGKVLKVKFSESHLNQKMHLLNYLKLADLIALGGALVYLQIASEKWGYRAQVIEQLDFEKNNICEIYFSQMPAKEHPLFNQLTRRCTDRRVYQNKMTQENDFLKPDSNIEDSNIKIYTLQKLTPELLKYLLEAEKYIWSSDDFSLGLLNWIRYSKADALATKNGMPWYNLGINKLDALFLNFIKNNISFRRLFKFGLNKVSEITATKQYSSSERLIMFTTSSFDNHSLVDIGRAGVLNWLELTKRGFAVQPMSIGALMIYLLKRFGRYSENITSADQKMFEKGEGLLREAFGFSPQETPVWMFRTGSMPSLPKEMRTYRKDLNQILSIET